MRQILRNIMKSQTGSNKIGQFWRAGQIKKYGFKNWLWNMFIPCSGGYYGHNRK